MKAVPVTDMQTDVHVAAEETRTDGSSTLLETLRTAVRLVPRQITDEVELAKLELADKKSRLGGIAIAAGIAVVFLALLVIALTVAAIAGLATVMPLWLSALLVSAALALVIAISAFIAVRKSKAVMPIVPEHAWRGIRHDLGIARQGRDFDPSTLVVPELSREEKKARAAAAAAEKAAAEAERAAKAAEHGPTASTEELLKRTDARRAHLLELREEIVQEADIKKQAGYFIDTAVAKTRQKATSVAGDAVEHGRELAGQAAEVARERWKPLAVLAVSAAVCAVLLRKLARK